MAEGAGSILTDVEFSDYEELGFLHSIPILSEDEVRKYRAEVDKTVRALGCHVTRLNAPHLFFPLGMGLEHASARARLSGTTTRPQHLT